MRGSTSTACFCLLMSSSTRMSRLAGILVGIGDGAHRERRAPRACDRRREACRSSIVSMSASAASTASRTALLLERGCRSARRPHRAAAERRSPRRCRARSRVQRPSASSATCAAADTNAKSLLPRVDLVEADADPRLGPDREAHRGQAGGLRQRRHHRTDEEFARHAISLVLAALAPGAASRRASPRPARSPPPGRRWRASRRSCRAPASAYGRRSGITLASSGSLARTSGSFSTDALPGGGADRDLVALVADVGQSRDARDVDQPRRPRQPHRHQRHQRLPAGDQPRAIVGREQGAGFVECRRDANTRTQRVSSGQH